MDGLVSLDERVFLALNRAWSPEFDAFFSVATYLGHGVVLALLVLGPMALWDRKRLRVHFLALVLSVGGTIRDRSVIVAYKMKGQ